VWSALARVLRRELGGGAPLAAVLRCEPSSATPDFAGRLGQTLPGFRVVEAAPERLLVLAGRHRFSRYRLTFVLDEGRLRARTHAAFPGLPGRLYRTMVIGSGAHRILTRRLLEQVARQA
ncbi:MAG: hypothetical protein H0U42_03545, partial [Thermoleophilaceae bacterium]|nr:hypothetical protein [Thermoleophilaceae bacterium]